MKFTALPPIHFFPYSSKAPFCVGLGGRVRKSMVRLLLFLYELENSMWFNFKDMGIKFHVKCHLARFLTIFQGHQNLFDLEKYTNVKYFKY